MKKLALAALLAALLTSGGALASLDLETGRSTPVPLRVLNHALIPLKGVRAAVASDSAWLRAELPPAFAGGLLPEVKEGGALEAALLLVLERDAPLGAEGRLTFTLWPEEAGAAQAPGAQPSAWTSWQLVYTVKACRREEALDPGDLEWHFVSARRASTNNEVRIRVKNGSPIKPLENVTVTLISSRGRVCVPDEKKVTEARDGATEVKGVEGLQVIKPNGAAEYKVGFMVAKTARLGEMGTIHLRVRTATLGVRPNPWEPAVLVRVEPPDIGLPGNFEAFLCYNLPPLPGGKAAADPSAWLPLPQGTRISVSEVYRLPGPGGVEKWVEQYVGYGNVVDHRGFCRLRLNPVERSSPRLRVVAETMANRMELQWADTEQAVLSRMAVKGSRAAVTPWGKTLFRNISNVFRAELEQEATLIPKGGEGTEGERVRFYRVLPGQEHNFIAGEGKATKRILIPYYGYERDLDPKKTAGIPIGWEGELSTGGHINFFQEPSFGDNPGIAGGLLQGGSDLWKQLKGEHADYAQELLLDTKIGLIYHNHNELHHVLSCLVRAQEALARLPFFRTPMAAASQPAAAPAPPELPGVIALWRKLLDLSPGETGWCLREDGTWRLMVQGRVEDPDERDAALVLRGYGAAVRRLFFERREGEGREEGKAPLYEYGKRTSLRRAWEQGFDLFFAAWVLGSGRLENQVAAEPGERERRSVDLDSLLGRALKAAGEPGALAKLSQIRGADNAVAVAAGLWQASRRLLPETDLLSELLAAKGGDLAWLIGLAARRRPDLLQDMAALGLSPRVSQFPPAAAIRDSTDPAALAVLWDANGVLARGNLEPFLEYGDEATFSSKPVRLSMGATGEGGKGSASFPFGRLRDRDEGAAMLNTAWQGGRTYFWRVVTRLPDGSELPWPAQSFVARLPALAPGARDRSVPMGPAGGEPTGRLDVPGGAVPSPLGYTAYSIHSVLGGMEVLGKSVYRITLEGGEAEFAKPLALTLSWLEREVPGRDAPGIRRLDENTGEWVFQGAEPAGQRSIRAEIRRPGTFALMVDRRTPGLLETQDGPDPFLPGYGGEGGSWRLSFRLSVPAAVTVELQGPGKAPFRKLLAGKELPVGPAEVFWDGTDEAGRPAPDGTYAYSLLAQDRNDRSSEPCSGTVRLCRGLLGGAAGEVRLARSEAGPALVSLEGGDLFAECGGEGRFWLPGLPPGRHGLRISAPGHFPETVAAEVGEGGGDVELPPVSLSDRALQGLEAGPECFSPDGDGEDDFVVVNYSATRVAPLSAAVFDAEGGLAGRLLERKEPSPGPQALLWQGLDGAGRRLPSGWYEIRLVAWNGEEEIPQGSVRVLLDRGLVQEALPFPRAFSPNGDGFDDEVELGYRLETDADISISILDASGAAVRAASGPLRQRAGWNAVRWDGKGEGGKVLPDGPYGFEIRSSYPSGHRSAPVRGTFALDAEAPALAEMTPLNGAVLPTGMPLLSARVVGSAGDLDPGGLRFKVDESTVAADAFDPASGVFTFRPKTSLGEGLHIAIAYAQDRAGNYAPPQAVSFQVKLAVEGKAEDRERPAVSDCRPGKGETVYSATPLLQARLLDAGSGIDPATIDLSLDGEKVATEVRFFIPGKSGKPWDWYSYAKSILLYDPLQGELRFVPLEPLAPGRHHFSLAVHDRAGNRSDRAEAVFSVVLDAEPPVVEILEPKERANLPAPDVRLVARLADGGGSGLEPGSLQLLANGREILLESMRTEPDPATGLLTLPLEGLFPRGTQHGLALTVRDRAGNVSRPAVRVFQVVEDPDPPRLTLISPADGAALPAGRPVAFAAAVFDIGRSGIDEASVRLLLDGSPVPPDRRETAAVEGWLLAGGLLRISLEGLRPGSHVVSLEARDRAGNAAPELVVRFQVR